MISAFSLVSRSGRTFNLHCKGERRDGGNRDISHNLSSNLVLSPTRLTSKPHLYVVMLVNTVLYSGASHEYLIR